jgi:periplasmic divalent cation tolerance protein
MDQAKHVVIFVTAKDKPQAQKIARALLEDKLVACANIVDGVQSLYWWQGKIDDSAEALLVLKTQRSLFKNVAARVKALHSYETAEVIAMPIVEGSPEYLNWIDASVSK